MNESEIWVSVKEWSEYEVSNLGRVRRGARIKSPFPDRKGYLRVKLWDKQIAKNLFVHRIVAAAFIGPIQNGLVCRHLNGNKVDNRSSNLGYGTPAQNESDKKDHGTALSGEGHHQSKLTTSQVELIRLRYKRGCSINGGRALGKEFGVSDVQIVNIASGKHWARI